MRAQERNRRAEEGPGDDDAPGQRGDSIFERRRKANFNGSQRTGNILELNASDERGIDIVKEQIKSFCQTLNSFSNFTLVNNENENLKNNFFKLVILDEADMMTTDAQSALRRIMEKYTNNVRFILICNQVHKIHPAVQSRCMRFRFRPIKNEECLNRLKEICKNENVKYGNDNITILQISDDAVNAAWGGDWRIPPRNELQNLYEHTIVSWVTNYQNSGINGKLFVDKTSISALLSLTMLLLILNPKLSFKIYSIKEVDAEGNEVLKRPKVIVIALTEWISIFVYFLSPISLLLISLI